MEIELIYSNQTQIEMRISGSVEIPFLYVPEIDIPIKEEKEG